jgi:chemotaxis protein CheD
VKCLKQAKTNEYIFGKSNDILETSGIGSCVVIMIWDRHLKLSALSHISSPTYKGHFEDIGITPSATLPCLFNYFHQKGSKNSDLEICLVGAGDMFNMQEGDLFRTGDSITKEIKTILKEEMLNCTYQDTGGRYGRKVKLWTACGQIEIKNTNGDKRYFNENDKCFNC